MAIKSVLGGDFTLGERTDEQLIELARSGGSRTGAWDELYRRHASSARKVARHLLRARHEADDVVNEAFAGVISAIGHGAGPRDNFRQYLMACVRNGCKTCVWKGDTRITTDPSVLEQKHGAVFEDAEQFGEAGLVASAFSSLSVDWQRALWLTAVEERPAADIARELGKRPAAVAALAHRAREAFAEEYLAQHQQRAVSPACERITPKLAHYVRNRAGDIDTARVEHHLSGCRDCTRAAVDLCDVNSSLRTLALPASLAGACIVAASTVAPIAGLGAVATLGGWSATIVGGFTFAKVAVIAALFVPAALIATDAAETPRQTIAESASAGDAPGDAEAAHTVLTKAASESPATNSGSGPTSLAPTATAPAASLPGAGITVPIATVAALAVPGGSDPTVSSLVGAGVTTVATAVVNPVGTTQRPSQPTIAIPPAFSIPAIAVTPTITVPGITVPASSLPGISTPPTAVTPQVNVTSIPLPLITTPAVALPPIAVPSISTPPISSPLVVIPAVTLPPLVVPLTVAESPLPKLQLPLPRLPDLLGS